jgi:hypothetical protein
MSGWYPARPDRTPIRRRHPRIRPRRLTNRWSWRWMSWDSCRAELINGSSLNACRKLPTWRAAAGSHSSADSPTSLGNPGGVRQGHSVVLTARAVPGVDQPEAARQEGALATRQPVDAGSARYRSTKPPRTIPARRAVPAHPHVDRRKASPHAANSVTNSSPAPRRGDNVEPVTSRQNSSAARDGESSITVGNTRSRAPPSRPMPCTRRGSDPNRLRRPPSTEKSPSPARPDRRSDRTGRPARARRPSPLCQPPPPSSGGAARRWRWSSGPGVAFRGDSAGSGPYA